MKDSAPTKDHGAMKKTVYQIVYGQSFTLNNDINYIPSAHEEEGKSAKIFLCKIA